MQFFKGQGPPYRGVAYRPDGRTLITATQSGVVTLWDLDAGKERARFLVNPRGERINSIAVSPDHRLLAAVGRSLTVLNLDTGDIPPGFECPNTPLRGVAFALGGKQLVAGLYNRWSSTTREFGLAMWNVTNGAALPTYLMAGYAHPLAVSADGQSVFGDCNTRLVRWHLPTRQEFATQFATPSHSSVVAVSPVAGVVAQGIYQQVEVRDANGEPLLAQWKAHNKGVFAMAFSPDGALLATGSGDEVVKLWDVSGVQAVLADPNARPLAAMPERGAYEWGLGPVRAIAFSPDSLTAAAVGDRVKLVVWDVE